MLSGGTGNEFEPVCCNIQMCDLGHRAGQHLHIFSLDVSVCTTPLTVTLTVICIGGNTISVGMISMWWL